MHTLDRGISSLVNDPDDSPPATLPSDAIPDPVDEYADFVLADYPELKEILRDQLRRLDEVEVPMGLAA